MKVSPWKSGWLVLQIRALSGTDVRLLDREQRSVNSSLEEKNPEPQQVQNIPNISDCAGIVPVQFMKDYRGKCVYDSGVTLRAPRVFN